MQQNPGNMNFEPRPQAARKPPARKGTTRLNINPTVTWQDLSKDRLVSALPFHDLEGRFTEVRGKLVPILGGIVLWSRLGQGAMGTVYYGIHTRLDIEVAVKILPFNVAKKTPIRYSVFSVKRNWRPNWIRPIWCGCRMSTKSTACSFW